MFSSRRNSFLSKFGLAKRKDNQLYFYRLSVMTKTTVVYQDQCQRPRKLQTQSPIIPSLSQYRNLLEIGLKSKTRFVLYSSNLYSGNERTASSYCTSFKCMVSIKYITLFIILVITLRNSSTILRYQPISLISFLSIKVEMAIRRLIPHKNCCNNCKDCALLIPGLTMFTMGRIHTTSVFTEVKLSTFRTGLDC